MTDEFDFFSNDSNNWNYNPFINTPNADPYNNKRVFYISCNNSYNLMKYNTVIMLKEIIKYTSKYVNDDVKEWIYKKALQDIFIYRECVCERECVFVCVCARTHTHIPGRRASPLPFNALRNT